jgi:hypothetical protein
MSEGVHLFGIRHHGPGSAHSLLHALETLDPDIVLIEGPPDANALIPLAGRADLEPPVALLIYVPEQPRSAVLYPFARFSPEWQAIQFALARGKPVRFIDLPQSARLKVQTDTAENTEAEEDTLSRGDPLQPMATAAGYSDAERWWDHLVESRAGNDFEVFAAIHEMMSALRAELESEPPLVERQREAYMRKSIRAARSEGFTRIAVVCGAYHTPALELARAGKDTKERASSEVAAGATTLAARMIAIPSAREDEALLRGLPKTKTAAAWVPWSYERLCYMSGYGAGIESPVWYELLWEKRRALGAEWITRAARLLRAEDIPVSSAHVIEACRLADALAAVRGRPVPGLPEFNDAAIAVLGSGDALNLRLIHARWHFDARLGKVPEDFPAAPLQQDLAALQRRLRLPPKAEDKTLDLDLREAMDRERSHLLRRLRILGIDWGIPAQHGPVGKGTFHELWQIRWQPEFAIALIEASHHGHTVEQAASGAIVDRSTAADQLSALVSMLEDALFADLPDAIQPLVTAIENRAAAAADVLQLLDAAPPLVSVYRYGNVRETDVALVAEILRGLVPRMLIGLPPACSNIDDDAAHELWKRITAVNQSLMALSHEEYLQGWRETLGRLTSSDTTHPLLAGYAHRLLYDAQRLQFDDLARALSLALSAGNAPSAAAGWIEGLLSGSSMLLIHDERLRALLDGWLREVPDGAFIQALPLLRRTFSEFPPAERRMLGAQLSKQRGATRAGSTIASTDFDEQAARAAMNVLKLIWRKDSSDDAR